MPTPPLPGRADSSRTLTLILAGGQGERLHPLSRDRAKPAVPFGGSYRIVDFTLSNCLNSGLRRVFVLTQYKSLSLERHIRQGWNLLNESLDEFIVPIPPQQRLGGSWYLGTADAIYQNIYTLEEVRPAVVLVLSGDHVYKMDYGPMLAFHREREADLTVACIEVGHEEATHFGIAEVDDTGRIIGWREKPSDPAPIPGREGRYFASMGVYAWSTEPLVRNVSRDAKRETGHDFGRDVIPAMIGTGRVFAYSFKSVTEGEMPYWRDIGRLDAYYAAHQDLIAADPLFRLNDPQWPIRTRPVHLPPVRTIGGSAGELMDCLIAPGSVIAGGRVVRSILGYGVCVEEGAEVSGSILLDDVRVESGARVRNTIVEKRVVIPAGMKVGYDRREDARRFTVTEQGVVVIPKGLQL